MLRNIRQKHIANFTRHYIFQRKFPSSITPGFTMIMTTHGKVLQEKRTTGVPKQALLSSH